ncbi:MAG: DUF3823 domain-containing protein [Bacteroidota bacterium]|nr:DUF3823 domain-containing protein [Bacteroidota bacterium]MDP4205467.1 DUF3823 domain-containing protein [Bacteroidota bacterium]
MKNKVNYILLFALSILFVSCAYDNYDAPKSTLHGSIMYKGDTINVERSNGDINNATVYFELWEPGWQKQAAIRVMVNQDGTFNTLLFNANYKLVIPKGQGPFMSLTNAETNSDTIPVRITGNKTMNIEVLPFYMIRNPLFSASGRTVSASCQLEQIIKDANARNIERVTLYISKTSFADGQTNIVKQDLSGSAITDLANVNLNVNVPTFASLNLPDQNYVFARIGLKIQNTDDMIFTSARKIKL